jgi:oxygen-independent coproporphyrinogen-3 oxidase
LHLYLHIPFCKQACHYCDFHFSTQLNGKERIVQAILKEIDLQKKYLQNKSLKTIYFGGGTPSLLTKEELDDIFQKINEHFDILPQAEITLEANPEDLNIEYLSLLKKRGINRLSIGVQSFQDKNLLFLNRNHSADIAKNAIHNAQLIGINNISIDLIFGIPQSTTDELKADILTAVNLNISHISAYSLTIEPKTVFGVRKRKKQFQEIPDIEMAKQFEITHSLLENNGFEGYEISNFAKDGNYSKHNTSYWMQEEYLGIGPSAHSYNGNSRQWNISNNSQYCHSMENSSINAEIENLSNVDKLNEYVMTRLRTKWGIDLNWIEKMGNFEQLSTIHSWVKDEFGIIKNNHFILNHKGRIIADKLSSDIFIV